MLKNETKTGFCIWTKTGRRPHKFHDTREAAEAEAVRLAESNPGKKFIIMEMLMKVYKEQDIGG